MVSYALEGDRLTTSPHQLKTKKAKKEKVTNSLFSKIDASTDYFIIEHIFLRRRESTSSSQEKEAGVLRLKIISSEIDEEYGTLKKLVLNSTSCRNILLSKIIIKISCKANLKRDYIAYVKPP